MIGLIRQPLNVALTVAEGALDASLAVVRAARGLIEEDVADTRWTVADHSPTEPAPPVREPVREPAAPVAEPAPPTPVAEDHVSEEPVAVADFAEEGAEEGAGAELNVAEPWEGYAAQGAGAIVSELSTASREALAAVELYESMHKRRRSVMTAAERRLKALSGPAAPQSR